MGELFDIRLSNIERKLDEMVDALAKIAVQKERLDKLEQRTDAIFYKWDKLIDPDNGMLLVLKSKVLNSESRIESMQWIIKILGLTSIGCTVSLFSLAYYVWRMAGVG